MKKGNQFRRDLYYNKLGHTKPFHWEQHICIIQFSSSYLSYIDFSFCTCFIKFDSMLSCKLKVNEPLLRNKNDMPGDHAIGNVISSQIKAKTLLCFHTGVPVLVKYLA